MHAMGLHSKHSIHSKHKLVLIYSITVDANHKHQLTHIACKCRGSDFLVVELSL